MADRYIDEAYVHAAMEASVVRALLSGAGSNLNTLIESNTDLVKGYLRNSGYTLPSPTAPATEVRVTDVTDAAVKLAVLCCVRRSLCSLPSSSLELPEDYNAHPETIALRGILSGDVILSLSQSTIQSPGGMKFSDSRLKPQLSSNAMLFGSGCWYGWRR